MEPEAQEEIRVAEGIPMDEDIPVAEDIRVAIVDDHEFIRSGLSKLLNLEEGIRVVAGYPSGVEALARVPSNVPDVILMDIKMPGMDGLAATRELCARVPEVRIIVLTMFDDYMSEAFAAGAVGFVRKDVSGGELAECIRRVLGGEIVTSTSLKTPSATQEATTEAEDEAGPYENIFGAVDVVHQVTLQIFAPEGARQAMSFINVLTEHLDAKLLQSAGTWNDGTMAQIAFPAPARLAGTLSQLQKLPQVDRIEQRSTPREGHVGFLKPLQRSRPQSEEKEDTLLIVLKDRVPARPVVAG